jgi:hypothetical protein
MVYSNNLGLKITDAMIERLELTESNKIAEQYSIQHYGKDWMKLIEKKAIELYRSNLNYKPHRFF